LIVPAPTTVTEAIADGVDGLADPAPAAGTAARAQTTAISTESLTREA
jgi:hypothetical protein